MNGEPNEHPNSFKCHFTVEILCLRMLEMFKLTAEILLNLQLNAKYLRTTAKILFTVHPNVVNIQIYTYITKQISE